MARKPRLHFPGAFYHVMLRGNAGQVVFHTDDDRNRFYLLLQEGVSRFEHRIHAFCLMDNHIHLVIQVANTPLSKIVQNFSFRYTRWVNKKQKRVGHLFQGRYKAILVDADCYLLSLIRYVHLNPVKANLVKDPVHYSWSSHSAYLGLERICWLTTCRVLGQFSEETFSAQKGYQRFICENMDQANRYEEMSIGGDIRILGDEDFAEKAISTAEPLDIIKTNLNEIIKMTCQAYCLTEKDLSARGQLRIPSQARALVGWIACETTSGSITEVAQRFRRDVATLSTGMKRLRQHIKNGTQGPWISVLEAFNVKL